MNEETTPQQQQAEPVACRFCFSEKGCWTWQCYKCGEIDDVQKPTPQQQQAEPVAWDKPSASFNEWWDVNYEDPANPFEKDSAAWWAWAGWKAAQRPWVGLTDEEMSDIVADIDVDFGDLLWKVICLTKIIEATLKERNK